MSPFLSAPLLALALLPQPEAPTTSDWLHGEWLFAYVHQGRTLLEAIAAPDIDALTIDTDGGLRLVRLLDRADATGTWETTGEKLVLRLPINNEPGILQYDYRNLEDETVLMLSSLLKPESGLNGTAAEWVYFRPERFLDVDLSGRWVLGDSEQGESEMILGSDGQYSNGDDVGYYRTFPSLSGQSTILSIVARAEIDFFYAYEFERRGRSLFLTDLFPGSTRGTEQWSFEGELDSSSGSR